MEVPEQLQLALLVPGQDQAWLAANWLAGACVSASQRAGLGDWMVEVTAYLGVGDATLHLAVSHLDLVMGSVDVEEAEQQLLAIACIGLAAKQGEDFVPGPQLLLPLLGGGASQADLARLERLALVALEFRLHRTTSCTFLHYFVQLLPKEKRGVGRLARAILDLSLLAPWHGQVQPSHLAAAVLTLANCLLKETLALPLSLAASLLELPSLLSKDLHLTRVLPSNNTLLHRLLTVLEARDQMHGVKNKHSKALARLSSDNLRLIKEELQTQEQQKKGGTRSAG